MDARPLARFQNALCRGRDADAARHEHHVVLCRPLGGDVELRAQDPRRHAFRLHDKRLLRIFRHHEIRLSLQFHEALAAHEAHGEFQSAAHMQEDLRTVWQRHRQLLALRHADLYPLRRLWQAADVKLVIVRHLRRYPLSVFRFHRHVRLGLCNAEEHGLRCFRRLRPAVLPPHCHHCQQRGTSRRRHCHAHHPYPASAAAVVSVLLPFSVGLCVAALPLAGVMPQHLLQPLLNVVVAAAAVSGGCKGEDIRQAGVSTVVVGQLCRRLLRIFHPVESVEKLVVERVYVFYVVVVVCHFPFPFSLQNTPYIYYTIEESEWLHFFVFFSIRVENLQRLADVFLYHADAHAHLLGHLPVFLAVDIAADEN